MECNKTIKWVYLKPQHASSPGLLDVTTIKDDESAARLLSEESGVKEFGAYCKKCDEYNKFKVKDGIG